MDKVEAGLKSGSLDTAGRARKQCRSVYAIPGSEGTDSLLPAKARRLDPKDLNFNNLAADIANLPVFKIPPQPKQGRLF